MLIAQISDLHIAGRGKKTYGIAPMGENLRLCVDHINQLSPRPNLVLVTGDITDTGMEKQFEYARDLLSELNIPYYIIPGNHDDRSRFLSTFNHVACSSIRGTGDQNFVNYVIDDFEIRLIAVDSTVPGKPGGEICDQRANWLDQRLSENTEKPTLIFMHHPPVKLGVIETDVDGFTGADKLGKIVKKYNNIEGILCGHVHLPTFTRWQGTIVSTAPSIGMRLLLDLTLEQPPQFLLEKPAYQLHYWTAEKNLVSHLSEVKRSVSYRFEDDTETNGKMEYDRKIRGYSR